jgi:hypothetical protein
MQPSCNNDTYSQSYSTGQEYYNLIISYIALEE